MPEDKAVAQDSLFEYFIKALTPRSKQTFDLNAFKIAREEIERERKIKRLKRSHLRLVPPNRK